MKKSEIKVGGLYLAKVSGIITTVRVDRIREVVTMGTTVAYDVTNLRTGRHTTFRSAAKFRAAVQEKPCTQCKKHVPVGEDYSFGMHRECYEHSNAAKLAPVVNAGPKHALTLLDANHAAFDEAVECNTEAMSNEQEQITEQDEEENGVDRNPIVEIRRSMAFQVVDKLLEGEQCSDPTQPSPDTSSVPTVARLQSASSVGAGTGSVPPTENDRCSDPTSSIVPVTWDTSSPSLRAGADVRRAVSTATANTGFASRIAATKTTREVGSPVAGMVPNEEQESILIVAVESGLEVLVVGAGAGTGKTATLKMLEQVLPGRGQYTAFNASLVAESKAKFQKAACNTTHSLAFRAVGRAYQHRLGGERMRSGQIARILGIEDITILLRGMGESITDETGLTRLTDKPKTLRADFLSGQVQVAIRKFCQSADREIGVEHLHYIDGIDVSDADGKRGHENNDKVKDYLLPFARKAWADLSKLDGQLPFSHDCYVKIWQLGTGNDRPIISADYILLDEAQDTAPVFLDVLKQQVGTLLVFVGDSNQAIYEWRGAVDAMKAYPDASRRLLSQSYRFGQAIADVANAVLATLEEPTDLVMRGMPTIPSRVAEVAEPRCYLYRTNAGAVGRVMVSITESKKPHLVGSKDYVSGLITWCQAALDLQAKRGTRHPELCCFESWSEVVEYSKSDEGSDLKLMVKLVDMFGAAKIRDALRDMPKEEDADLVVSTAHKSKGREWDTVKLGPDFPLANRMTDADRRLLYVAATRAKLCLDITECPPFCGGNERNDYGEGADIGQTGQWVPGLTITYTQPTDRWLWPLPTAEEMVSNVGINDSGRMVTEAKPINGEAKATDKFTWTKFGTGWCVRGPQDVVIGTAVQVERRDGSTSTATVRRVMHRTDKDWVYVV